MPVTSFTIDSILSSATPPAPPPTKPIAENARALLAQAAPDWHQFCCVFFKDGQCRFQNVCEVLKAVTPFPHPKTLAELNVHLLPVLDGGQTDIARLLSGMQDTLLLWREQYAEARRVPPIGCHTLARAATLLARAINFVNGKLRTANVAREVGNQFALVPELLQGPNASGGQPQSTARDVAGAALAAHGRLNPFSHHCMDTGFSDHAPAIFPVGETATSTREPGPSKRGAPNEPAGPVRQQASEDIPSASDACREDKSEADSTGVRRRAYESRPESPAISMQEYVEYLEKKGIRLSDLQRENRRQVRTTPQSREVDLGLKQGLHRYTAVAHARIPKPSAPCADRRFRRKCGQLEHNAVLAGDAFKSLGRTYQSSVRQFLWYLERDNELLSQWLPINRYGTHLHKMEMGRLMTKVKQVALSNDLHRSTACALRKFIERLENSRPQSTPPGSLGRAPLPTLK